MPDEPEYVAMIEAVKKIRDTGYRSKYTVEHILRY